MSKLRVLCLCCLHLLTAVVRTYLVTVHLTVNFFLYTIAYVFCPESARCQYVLHGLLLIDLQRYADVAYLPPVGHRGSSHSKAVSHWQSSTSVRNVAVACHSFTLRFHED